MYCKGAQPKQPSIIVHVTNDALGVFLGHVITVLHLNKAY